jgi:hypothetical protein
MKTLGIGCALFVIACGGDDKAKGAAFASAYVEVVNKVAALCEKKRELLLQPQSAEKQSLEMAIAISMGRAVADYTLPEAPSSMAACRADAVAALDALETALAPLEKRGNEYKGQSVHIVNAVIREEWDKAKEPSRKALNDLDRSWASCRDQAKQAGVSTPSRMILPHFAPMGC